MTLSHKLSVTLTLTPTPLVVPVISGNLRIEENRSPRISAQLTVPATPALLALDPQRTVIWATITATTVDRVDLIRDISRRISGFAVGTLSALFAGKTLAQVLPTLTDPYTTTTSWKVQLRSVVEHWADDTITLGFKSAEAVLIDHKQPHDDAAVATPGATILAIVNQLLAVAGLTLTAWDAAATSAATFNWLRGVSIWDAINLAVRPLDLLLWVDNTGGLQLQKASWVSPAATLALTSSGPNRTVIDGGQYIDRDDPEFFNVVDNTWATGVFVGQAWTIAIVGDLLPPYKTRYIKHAGSYADTGLNSIPSPAEVKQSYRRGRGWKITAISDYSTVAARPISVQRPSAALVSGYVRSVEFLWPDDEMTVEIRESVPAGFGTVEPVQHP